MVLEYLPPGTPSTVLSQQQANVLRLSARGHSSRVGHVVKTAVTPQQPNEPRRMHIGEDLSLAASQGLSQAQRAHGLTEATLPAVFAEGHFFRQYFSRYQAAVGMMWAYVFRREGLGSDFNAIRVKIKKHFLP
jgi:hypothetical protein